LSNSLHKGNGYLIIGISDPSEGTKVIGLTEGQMNRKSQDQYIDFLRSKSFAGDCRPEIELHILTIRKKKIDVLEIFDNPIGVDLFFSFEDIFDSSWDVVVVQEFFEIWFFLDEFFEA
jgi:predicted HTH transcriptional regulator